jgi:beta-lactamase superfamily II metal-dependent hydrolase
MPPDLKADLSQRVLEKMMSILKIRLLPVGQADCILVKFPDNSLAVVDCGSTTRDTGTLMAFSLLQNEEPHSAPVRFVLATHPDEDHCLGIPGLLRLCAPLRKIEAFYHCGAKLKIRRKGPGPAPGLLLDAVATAEELVQLTKIDVTKQVKSGDRISWDPPIQDFSIYVLNPAKGLIPSKPISSGESNDASVCLLITFGKVHVLLTGDIEGRAWAHVVKHSKFHYPDIMKVPHHGALKAKPPTAVLDSSPTTHWALFSTGSRVVDKPHPMTLDEFGGRPAWRMRCTGLGNKCHDSNAERYPLPSDNRTYPESLRQSLEFSERRSIFAEHNTLLGCCVNNEIIVTAEGKITHSVESKTCDDYSEHKKMSLSLKNC